MGPTCNCFSLRQATRRVTQLYDQALMPLNLRATQFALLSEIERLGPVALNHLATAIVMDRATLGHNVRPLEARGLVQLTIGGDRRSREASITPTGHTLLVRAHKLWQKAQIAFEAQVGSDTATELRLMLHRVAATQFALS